MCGGSIVCDDEEKRKSGDEKDVRKQTRFQNANDLWMRVVLKLEDNRK